jgi:hypothetical protein
VRLIATFAKKSAVEILCSYMLQRDTIIKERLSLLIQAKAGIFGKQLKELEKWGLDVG